MFSFLRGLLVFSLLAFASVALAMENSGCPVTIPNGKTLPESSVMNHGNDDLLTSLPGGGIYSFRPGGAGYRGPNGSLTMKTHWWLLSPGTLSVTGRRLDDPSDTAEPTAFNNPNRQREPGFLATGLTFPGEGCWEVNATLADSTLTFVVQVEQIGDGPCSVLPSVDRIAGHVRTTDTNQKSLQIEDGIYHLYGERKYEGGLNGSSTFDFVVTKGRDDIVVVSGVERISGKPRGHQQGEALLQHQGTLREGILRTTAEVIPGSATGGLKNLEPNMVFWSGLKDRACYVFEKYPRR